jgi:hypothetical protein
MDDWWFAGLQFEHTHSWRWIDFDTDLCTETYDLEILSNYGLAIKVEVRWGERVLPHIAHLCPDTML